MNNEKSTLYDHLIAWRHPQAAQRVLQHVDRGAADDEYEVGDVHEEEDDAEGARQLEARDAQHDEREADAAEADEAGGPARGRGREDVRVEPDDHPREAEAEARVEGEGAEGIGRGHLVHAGAAREQHDRDEVGEAREQAEEGALV